MNFYLKSIYKMVIPVIIKNYTCAGYIRSNATVQNLWVETLALEAVPQGAVWWDRTRTFCSIRFFLFLQNGCIPLCHFRFLLRNKSKGNNRCCCRYPIIFSVFYEKTCKSTFLKQSPATQRFCLNIKNFPPAEKRRNDSSNIYT